MTYYLRGLKEVKFTTKDGQEISGTRLYCTTPMSSYEGKGESTDSFFLSDARKKAMGVPMLSVGDTLEIYFDRTGRVADIRVSSSDDDFVV